MLKDYNMSVLNHPDKVNMVEDGLCHLFMGSLSHVSKGKRNLVREVHRVAHLGVRIEDSQNNVVVVHHNSESSLMVEVKSTQHLYPLLIELNESVH